MPNFDKNQKTRLTYLSIFLVFIFGLEYLTRHFIWIVSLKIIPWMQTNLSFMIPLEHFLSFFGTERVMIIIMFVFFNFLNIYKTFLLIAVISIANFTTGILKMLYTQSRPYWVSDYIKPYQCEAGWANPSGHSLCSVVFYLTMWKLIFYERTEDKNEEIEERQDDDSKIWLFIIVLNIMLICFGRILLGVHGLNQILLGTCLGLAIYYFIFYILKVNPDDPYQLFYLISSHISYFLLVHLGLFILYTWLYFTVAKSNPKKDLFNTIVDLKGCSHIGNGKRFENDAYLNCTLIHLYLAAMLGIKIEYNYIFKYNINKWIEYNFGYNKHGQTERFLHKNYDYQWNHTEDFVNTMKRNILTMFFFFVMMIPYFIISYDANMIIVVLFKIFLPSVISVLLLFSYFKVFLGYFDAAKNINLVNVENQVM